MDMRMLRATDEDKQAIFTAVENEYNNYWKLNKAALGQVWVQYNPVHCLNLKDVTKDQLITDILTYRFGKQRMNIWRELLYA